MTHKDMSLKLGMFVSKKWGNKSKAGHIPCFFQHPMFRPKDYTPVWMRPGKGDCTTCETCNDNRYCSGFEPFGVGVIEVEVK